MGNYRDRRVNYLFDFHRFAIAFAIAAGFESI